MIDHKVLPIINQHDPSSLYQKLVDRSTLRQGFGIPVEYQNFFLALSGELLVHGETMRVKILLDGELYDAEWKNQAFDKTKYPDHKDVMQIFYLEGSLLVKHLCRVFSTSWSYVEAFYRIVHATKPTFNYHTLSFNFPNGLREKIQLNKHL